MTPAAALLLALVMATLTATSGAPDQANGVGYVLGVTAEPTVRPPAGAPLGAVGTPAVGGVATWYDAPAGQAAAGPTLRDLIGPDWRGSVVRVSANGRTVVVTLSDWCACGSRNGHDTLIDLDDADFARLAPLSRGVIEVSVEWGAIPLPPTDTARDLAYWLGVVR